VPAHELTGMPAVVPALSDSQYLLLELVSRMYDRVILSGYTLRSLKVAWCEYKRRSLLQIAAVVRLLHVAAETARAAARAAGVFKLDDDGASKLFVTRTAQQRRL
jgi:hypothetical protein